MIRNAKSMGKNFGRNICLIVCVTERSGLACTRTKALVRIVRFAMDVETEWHDYHM